MVSYNIIHYCRLCKKRFVFAKGETKRYYCKVCQKKVDKYNKEKE